MFTKFDNDLLISFANINYKKLKNKNFFFTGATGFIGKWVVGALLLANLINPKLSVIINCSQGSKIKTNSYIPDINLIKNELNLIPKVSLDQSIMQTYEWYLASK